MEEFSLQKFETFCSNITISSKEFGLTPLKWLGSQRYVMQEIAAGLKEDVHSFFVLKGRQMGISTVTLAMDLYWLFKHPGLQGAVVTDTDGNQEIFRSTLTDYMRSLPPKYNPGFEKHNDVQLLLKNSSRLQYLIAGTRKNGGLGRAKSANYMHATECSSWGDEEGFGSLMNSLAQKNPNRLYIYESTARGYNMWYQAWEVAKKSKTQRAIFAGWWLNELYRFERNSVEFRTYWDGEPTSDERVWVRDVFERYRYSIAPEQLAWWRWYVAEQMKGEEIMALQEMPPTEEYAFQLSGSKYFSGERVNQYYQRALKQEKMFFRYKFGLNFEDTEFIETTEDMAEVTLWATPEEGNKGIYVLGADPAYGSSEWADEFAATMLRCYADKAVQVLELGAVDWTEQQYAWAIAHLSGWYGGLQGNCMLALEMQGPGGAVFNELSNLKRMVASVPRGDQKINPFDVIGMVRDYLWRRQDSMGSGFAYQWQTNSKEKIRMFSTLRSYFERSMIEINSPDCVEQFRNIHRDGDKIGGEGRAKDDRVIALAIAVVCWNDWAMQEMILQGRTYHRENTPPTDYKQKNQVETAIAKFFNQQGIHFPGVK